ncbi:MAG TPA: di-heme oxidoredictase family protein [Pyrinomonadaceae bacterium]|nr:di-heme oxidoredictase family protein [Pyrinomonadaceae bacterium]
MKSSIRRRIFLAALVMSAAALVQAQQFGDLPAAGHVSQDEIENGILKIPDVIKAGGELFKTEFNKLDGLDLRMGKFNRIVGPETQSCADCHFKPAIGGAGPNAANVFAVPGDSNRIDVASPRNTNHMFGSGALELLGLEMTKELLAVERQARADARLQGKDVTLELIAKGITFGSITARPDGSVDKSKVAGVDMNLVVKPFGRKGIIRTLRQFTLNANNLHFGMQAIELVGDKIDADLDGVVDELTVGDISAETAWQATLPTPMRKTPSDKKLLEAVRQGEKLFSQIGCAECHLPVMTLKSPLYRILNPRVNQGRELVLDLTKDAQEPRLTANADGTVAIALYSDLKRHDMGVGLTEDRIQNGVKPSVFITVPLWGVGSTGPWLHDGRATTLHDAIAAHGGEAEASRNKYSALNEAARRTVVEFLKSLVLSDKPTVPSE